MYIWCSKKESSSKQSFYWCEAILTSLLVHSWYLLALAMVPIWYARCRFRFSNLVSASSPCPRHVRDVPSLQAVTLSSQHWAQRVLALSPARASSNNVCSRLILVILVCLMSLLRDVLRAVMDAQGQTSALECCSTGKTARGISSQLLSSSAQSFLAFSAEGLPNPEKEI